MDASIIVPNYNGAEHLPRLLPTLASQTSRDFEVIVIDDCSPDRLAVDYVKSFITGYANMRLIENEENIGFVRTCNKGFGLAQGRYICTLNNDTAVARTFVERNVTMMDADGSIGVLSCAILDHNGSNWFSGGLFKNGARINLKDDFQGIRRVDWVAGTACFYRKDLLEKVGHLDESFVMYHEDIDFCLRTKHRTEYQVCMFSDKLVTHYVRDDQAHPASLAKEERVYYYLTRNHFLLLNRYSRKHLPKILLQSSGQTIALLLGSVMYLVRLKPTRVSRGIRLAFATIRGTLDGLLQKGTR